MPTNQVPPSDFNWGHYVQVELHQLKIRESLESTLHDAEAEIVAAQSKPEEHTRFSFMSRPQPKPDTHNAEAMVLNVKHRLTEVQKTLDDNHKELHSRLHAWLNAHDPHYRLAAEVKSRYDALALAIAPMQGLFEDMRRRYGEARNEIGIAYDKNTGRLSPIGQASVDRLVASYANLIDAEEFLVAKVNSLNALVNGTMFMRMRLAEFQRCIAPVCSPGMEYSVMRANFEKGAEQVNAAIDSLELYVAKIRRVDYDRDEILREYREAEWRRRLFAMATSAE